MKNNFLRPPHRHVIIIGAGAAGLACARALHDSDVSCTLLEARDRIGGRAYSVTDRFPAIEYGAEFIHGAQPVLIDLLHRNHLAFLDLCDNHLYWRKGKLHDLPDFWEKLDKVNGLLSKNLRHDRNMEDFLKAHHKVIRNDMAQLYKAYIEGFQAADMGLIGERALAIAEKDEEPELNSQSQFRPSLGYSEVMRALLKETGLRRQSVHFNHEVQEILWDENGVAVRSVSENSRRTFHADYVVITVPIAVLKTKMKITPAIPDLFTALSSVHMGHVQRINFEFSERFWESLSNKPVGFLHSGSEEYFPTWWTQMPQRTNILNAWQGGPKAYEMSFWSEKKRIVVALRTLSRMTGRSLSYLQDHYLGHFTHNWSQDPFSLGAYSYQGILKGRENTLIRKPFEKRILIGGEGSSQGSDQGTVHGALLSGERCAKQILEDFG